MPYVPPWVSRLRLALALLVLGWARDWARPGEDLAECNFGTGIDGDPAVLRGGTGIRLGSQRPINGLINSLPYRRSTNHQLTRLVRVNELSPV